MIDAVSAAGEQRLQDIRFPSQGGEELTALLASPARPDATTGVLLVMHGWGGNRFLYRDMMLDLAERCNVYAVSPEWRGSGFHHDPVGGRGLTLPYDFSHLQTMDCLNSVQAVRRQCTVDDTRLFAWGGGQGGHIALLLAEFAPLTFAAAVNIAGFAYVDASREQVIGWTPSRRDREIRDSRRFADRVRAKVWLIHGGRDESVPIEHAYANEQALRAAGANVHTLFFPESGHQLDPATDRWRVTLDHLVEDFRTLRTDGRPELGTGEVVELPCTDGAFRLTFGEVATIAPAEQR